MTSKKQRIANQANAKRGTGPRSTEGKARSSLNSLKRGLTAEQIILLDEEAEDFEAHLYALQDQWAPVGPTEGELVERAAVLFWRLKKVAKYEASVLHARRVEVARERRQALVADPARDWAIGPAEKFPYRMLTGDRFDIGTALIHDSTNGDALGKVLRYETAISNALTRTLSMLIMLQSARQPGEKTVKAIEPE